MLRSLFALLVVAVVGTSQGCRICDSPYDYCGPVMPCGEGCGAGGCGHSGHGHGGHGHGGYSGGDGGCASCGNSNGGHAVEHSREYERGTVIQGQPTPAPMAIPPQSHRATPKTMSKATYEEAPLQSVRTQSPAMMKPAKMGSPSASEYGPRTAKKGSGPIFW